MYSSVINCVDVYEHKCNLCQIKLCYACQVFPFMQNQAAYFGEIFSNGWEKTTAKVSVWILIFLFHLGFVWREIVFSCLIALNSQMNPIYIFPFPYFATGTTFTQIKCEKQTKKSSDFPLTISQLTLSWHKCWPTSSSYITDPVLAPVLFGLTFQY